MKTKWQTWIDDTLAPGGGYMEDIADDIVEKKMATPQEINNYLISLDEEPIFAL